MNERKITVSDPSALGLFGLAIVTLVASSQKLGITQGTSFIIPWALFLGASCQLIAGMLDSKKCNLFGMTAFIAYAFFWYSVGFSWLIQVGVFGEEMMLTADLKQLGFAFIGYLIFSFYMTIGSLTTNKTLTVIFTAIVVLFIGLSMTSFNIAYDFGHLLGAYAELVVSIASFYGSAALILREQFGREVLPLGKAFIKKLEIE